MILSRREELFLQAEGEAVQVHDALAWNLDGSQRQLTGGGGQRDRAEERGFERRHRAFGGRAEKGALGLEKGRVPGGLDFDGAERQAVETQFHYKARVGWQASVASGTEGVGHGFSRQIQTLLPRGHSGNAGPAMIASGEKIRPRRSTNLANVESLQRNPFAGERGDARRFHQGVAGMAEVSPARVIREQNDDIRLRFCQTGKR